MTLILQLLRSRFCVFTKMCNKLNTQILDLNTQCRIQKGEFRELESPFFYGQLM